MPRKTLRKCLCLKFHEGTPANAFVPSIVAITIREKSATSIARTIHEGQTYFRDTRRVEQTGGVAVNSKNSTIGEKTVRIPGIAAAVVLVALCFALGALRGWLNQLPDDVALPAFVAFDILIVLGLLEAATWLAHLHEQVQSGKLPSDAGLEIRFRGLNLVIMSPLDKN
jgi:hypothetical protein